jgi:hypothetical protein
MVRLSVGRVAIDRCGVFVVGGAIYSKTEENLVVNVNVLAEGLVGIQRLNFTFDQSHSTCCGSFNEITVNFGYSSVPLHSLDKVFAWEVSDNLEFLIPVVHLLRIDAVEGHNCLTESVSRAHRDVRLRLFEPAILMLGSGGQEERLSVEDTLKVNLEVPREVIR